MEVLGLCSYPIEAAATRYRFNQFIAPLAEKGINLTVNPFLNSKEFISFYKSGKTFSKALGMLNPLVKRFAESLSARKFDVLLVQREAMMFGPPVFEWLAKELGGCPIVLDLDDATYVRYVSPTYGRLGSVLKFFGKTDSLIDWSEAVVCGNRFIAEYVEKRSRKAVVVPTVVDTDVFLPVEKDENKTPVVGWIGTHSTFPSVESIFPVLQRLSKKYDFILKIVGAGKRKVEISGVKIENLEWNLEREVEDFRHLDIGLYPLQTSSSANQEWLVGKSGFKAIQYLAVGIPFVVTPVGVCSEIAVEGETHFTAENEREWETALETLLQSFERRKTMGENGRKYSLENYTVARQTEKIAAVLHDSLENYGKKAKL